MAKKKTSEAAAIEAAPDTNPTDAPSKPIDPSIDICPRCNKPCHATEGTQDSIHLECLTPEERAVNDAPAEVVEPKPRRKGKKAKSDVTLEDLAARYLAHMEEIGKSAGTTLSYRLELITALDELGKDTKLADVTPQRVLEFFTCDRVMKTRTGVAKARPTFLKTQRVLRLALVWAQEAGLIEKAPLPEDLATF
jgi:hypothetical protein